MCILIDTKNKTLIDSKTGDTVKPSCFDDLIAYHSYLLTSKHPKLAHQTLKDVFKGEKVITNMIESFNKNGTKKTKHDK